MWDYKELRSMSARQRLGALLLRTLGYLPLLFGVLSGALWLIPVFWSDARVRALVLVSAVVVGATMLLTWSHEHYIATALPAMAGLLFVILHKVRVLRFALENRRPGAILTGLALLLIAVTIYMRRPNPSLAQRDITAPNWRDEAILQRIYHDANARDDMIANFERSGQKHLVIVHYNPGHKPLPDWVHNSVNLDRQAVIWARDLGEEENRKLIDYYRGRRAWRLNVTDTSYSLVPY